MTRDKGKWLMGLAMALSGVAWRGAALAASSDPNALEEVVVTAERRSVDIQKVAASVVVLDSDALKERGVENLDSLQYQVPSLSFTDQGNVKFFNIRGIGLSEGAPNQSIGVATHLDGTVIAREFNINDAFFDVASVEVLRGPQGTYSGQNSEGGAVFINSAKPVIGDHSGFADFTFASYGRKEIGAGLNIPLTSTLAARLSANGETRNSYYNNLGPGGTEQKYEWQNQPGNLTRTLGRAQLLYKPNDRVEARLIYQFSDRHSDGPVYLSLNGRSFDSSLVPGNRTINFDYPEALNTRYDRTTGLLTWDLGESVQLKVAETWQKLHQFYAQDGDGTSPLVSPTTPQSANMIIIDDRYSTGEVDLLSRGNGPFQWTTGFTYLDYWQGGAVLGSNYTTVPNFNVGGLNLYIDTVRRNQSAFGEAGYRFAGDFELKAGVRYNRDQAGFTPKTYLAPVGGLCLCAGPVLGAPIVGSSQLTELSSTTGRVLLNWTPATDQLVYFTVSRGYKPGGRTPFNLEYKSEFVTNYEAGWKATMLDNHLRSSVSVFHMDYNGYQATYATDPLNPAAAVTKNVDGTKINGVELQLDVRLAAWHVDLSGSFLDSKYGNLEIVDPATVGPGSPGVQLINLDGRTISYAPKFSGNIGVRYDIPLAGGTLTPSLRVVRMGSQWANFAQAPYNLIPGRTTLDLRLLFASNQSWQAEGFVTNLLDEVYANVVSSGVGYGNAGNYQLGAPREMGVTLRYRF